MKNTHYAVCINNDDYEVSLELGKLYEVLPDPFGSKHGLIRILDESGEDYLYETERFFPIVVPQKLAKALRLATANNSSHRTRPRGLAKRSPAPARR